MNRERGVIGGNSYEKELAYNPLSFLQRRLQKGESVVWLDLCCGTGKALVEAAQYFSANGLSGRLQIIGVDLVGMFAPQAKEFPFLQLLELSLTHWQPDSKVDLLTSVHGLHYIGDKIELIQKTAAWLKADGKLLMNFDPSSVKSSDGRDAGKAVIKLLRRQGLRYENRKHLLICEGQRSVNLNCEYLGADDQAGPNYTGQPAVNSYYAMVESHVSQKSLRKSCDD